MDRQVVLTNGDVNVIRMFLRWLDLMSIPEEMRTYRLSIHESADVRHQEEWWAVTLGIPRSAFLRPTLKRHKPTTIRRNTGEGYHGCLVVRVRRSSSLYDRIEGMWHALTESLVSAPVGLAEPSRVV